MTERYQCHYTISRSELDSKQSYQFIVILLIMFIIGTSTQSIEAQSDCFTPERSTGQCVPYQECDHIVEKIEFYKPNLPRELTEYITSSHCTGSNTQDYYICCNVNLGSKVRTTTTTITTTTTTTTPRAPPSLGPSPFAFIRSADNFDSSMDSEGVKLLSSITCGVRETKRVSGGNDTRIGEFPWMALLRYDNPTKPFQCGGSLITNRYVLTATHCMKGRTVIGVRLGEHDINSDKDCEQRGPKLFCAEPSEDFGVETTFTHPEYSRADIVNDVGLIKLDREVTFKRNIKPICLPLRKVAALTEFPETFYIAGWGNTETKQQANRLQKARLPPRPVNYCQDIFTKYRLNESHICAGGENSVGSCHGDSGGPLFAVAPYQDGGVRYVQYGIVSIGVEECGAAASYPGIYANIVHFMPWITKTILS